MGPTAATLPAFTPQKLDSADDRIASLELFVSSLWQKVITQEHQLQETKETIAAMKAGMIENTTVELPTFVTAESPTIFQDECCASRKSFLELEDEIDNYVWSESIWDLSYFIGLEELPAASSAFVACLMCGNAALQLLLCFIINDAFAVAEVDDETVDSMRTLPAPSDPQICLVGTPTPPAFEVCLQLSDSLVIQ